jgi:hypothetical protein
MAGHAEAAADRAPTSRLDREIEPDPAAIDQVVPWNGGIEQVGRLFVAVQVAQRAGIQIGHQCVDQALGVAGDQAVDMGQHLLGVGRGGRTADGDLEAMPAQLVGIDEGPRQGCPHHAQRDQVGRRVDGLGGGQRFEQFVDDPDLGVSAEEGGDVGEGQAEVPEPAVPLCRARRARGHLKQKDFLQ